MRHRAKPSSPVVVKVGTSSLTDASGGIDADALKRVVDNVEASWDAGHPTALVTSGAIAAGLPAMGLDRRPRDVPSLQVAASVGQGRLMTRYTSAFESRGRQVGQVLLTRDVLARREQYLNARGALQRMLALNIVPIINENDAVVTDEVRVGDNDSLAAMASHLVGAGMLILLTDTSGLYTGDPSLIESAELLSAVRHTDEVLDDLRRSTGAGALGSGGVATKIAAARMAAWSGIPTVIASASEPDVVIRSLGGEDVGTWVSPRESGLSARKLWIAFGCPSAGTILIDEGADRALKQGRSLLAVGVVGVDGEFSPGEAVEVAVNGRLAAKGLVTMGSDSIGSARGQHSELVGGEVIHRDDLVVLT